MVKNPRQFPAWVLREALTELVERRAADRPPPGEALPMFVEDPDRVMLVCPRPECLAENEICELATGMQWNELIWDIETEEIDTLIEKGVSFQRSGFACRNCTWEVTVPGWLEALVPA
ncbi:hypothetical protein [Kribbella sancticallisti]